MMEQPALRGHEKGRWSRCLERFIFFGLLLLTILVLRNPDVRSAWRAGLLLLGVLSFTGWLMWKPAFWKGIVPQVRRLALAGMAFVTIVVIASLAGPTVKVAPEQLFLGFMLPVLIPWLIFRHVRGHRRWDYLMWAFAGAALLLVFRNVAQYIHEWLTLGKLSSDVHLHRRFAVNLVFGFPFLLWIAVSSGQRWLAATGWLLAVVSLLMIMATGARGAWLGAFVVILTYLMFLRSRRLLVISAAGLAIAIIAGLTVIPPELVVNKIQQGMDTSNRTAGTWGPAIEMIRDRPLLGYGLGDDVFHQEFNRRVVTEEHWSIRQSLGPHSYFLALGFAAGLPALLVLLMLFGLAVWPMGHRVPKLLVEKGEARNFGLSGVALLAAVSGTYGIIGNVENLNWNLFGFWLGMSMVWLQLDASNSLPDPGS